MNIGYSSRLVYDQDYYPDRLRESTDTFNYQVNPDKIYSPDRSIFINLSDKNNYNKLRHQIKQSIEGGENVFMYFDTNRTNINRKRFSLMGVRNGAFNIARELDIPITPIVMDHLYISGGIIPPQRFEICVGESRCIRSKNDVDEILRFYKKTLNRFLSQKFKSLK